MTNTETVALKKYRNSSNLLQHIDN